ncbi:hypothetical protein ACFOY2_10435 [Nonomuraea purpurea]|uniref:Uncharacterized protein n=1 Tax=Nonomuraea purpurea TaxID=1849276 RepID=A0ABV8G4U7_9ACTN
MAGNGRRWPIGLILLVLGPVLTAVYAGVNHVAIRMASKAQVTGPEWQGGRGRVGADGLTSMGVDAWRLTWWIAAFAGVLAVAFVVIGLLLRRRSRGRTVLLVLSGVLIVPYAFAFFVALYNPMRLLAGLYDQADFENGIPSWQSGTALLLLAAGLSQAIGLSMAAGEGKRARQAADAPPAP